MSLVSQLNLAFTRIGQEIKKRVAYTEVSAANIGNSPVAITSNVSQEGFVAVHLVTANYDQQFLLAVFRNPYSSGGTVQVISSTTVNNGRGFSAPVWTVSNYQLYVNGTNWDGTVAAYTRSSQLGHS